MSAALDLAAASAAVGLSDGLSDEPRLPDLAKAASIQRPRLKPTDIPGVGPNGWAMVADSGEHPDRRIPYALSHEVGAALDEIDPRGFVS